MPGLVKKIASIASIASIPVHLVQERVPPFCGQSYRSKTFDFAMREGNKRAYVDIFVEFRYKNVDARLSEKISEIEVPVLVMWGTNDKWIPFEHFEKYKRDLPSAKYIAYEGAGHISMEEIPEETVRDAIAFMR